MKKILALIFMAVLLFTFAACGGGGGASSDPNSGHYEATTLEMMGFTLDVAEVFPDGFSMDLMDGGKAKFNYDGKSYNMKWTLDGTTFHAEGGGAELDGTLASGVMQLSDVMGSGLEITLVNAEAAGGDAPAPAAAAGDYSWWDGQWYGWRVIYEAGGGYEDLIDNGYDVVANIKVDGDKGTVTVWDYDESEADALVTAEVSFQSGLTDKGSMVSESGEAFFEPLSKGSWVVDPGDDMVSAAGDMICIEGTNVDSDNSDDWFTYMIFLRPWGVDWSDLETVDDSNFPYNDMVPFHHEDWYKGQL